MGKVRRRAAFFYAALACAFLLLAPLLSNYYQIVREQVEYDRFARGSIGLTLYMAAGGVYEAAVSSYKSMVTAFTAPSFSRESQLPSIELRLSKGSLDALVADRPKSTRARYYNAQLKYPDGKWRRIKYRMRGSSSWHHQIQKPSLRLKLRRENPIGLLRHINLINPEDRPMLANIMADDIARKMGVLAHASRFVRVFINDRYRGVYQMQTRGDEEMLRAAGRIPGPLFLGENLKPGWFPGDFEFKGETKWIAELPKNPIAVMVNALFRDTGVEQLNRLWRILDFEKYARYQAVTSVVGTWHIDAHHNQGFFFDPSRGLLEPMLLDANGHGMTTFPATWRRFVLPWKPDHTSPLNGLNHPLSDVAIRDPRFHHARNEHLWSALIGVASTKSQHAMMKAYYDKMDPDVYADRHKGAIYRSFVGYTRFPYTNADYDLAKDQMFTWVENRNRYLKDQIGKTRVVAHIAPNSLGGETQLTLIVVGNSAVKFAPGRLRATLLADRDLDGQPETPVTGEELLHPGLRADPNYSYEHVTYGIPEPKRTFFGGAQKYLFSLKHPRELHDVLSGAFRNAVTNEKLDPVWLPSMTTDIRDRLAANVSLHPWRFPASAPPRSISLGPGRVALNQTLTVEKGDNLTIRPGTTLLLAHDVSVIVKGKLQMVGTADKPITIERMDKNAPWGALLVMGQGAAGSEIQYANISGGSKATVGLLPLLGMVNVHWVPGISIQNSKISHNVGADDTLHVIHSQFTLRDVSLNDCAFDCIDFDYAVGQIQRLSIERAGNDGVDFMESAVDMKSVRIERAGDKGLSVGEGSRVNAQAGSISAAKIGIAVKDASQLTLSNWKIDRNEIGVDIYKKNWRYRRPGVAVLDNVSFSNNATNVHVAKGGRIDIRRSGPIPRVGGAGRIEIERLPGS